MSEIIEPKVGNPKNSVSRHIADKNGAVVDILSKYPFGHSHSQLQLQIYLEKMVLTKQTDVLLCRRACVKPTAVARFFTTEYEISGRVVTVRIDALPLQLGFD